MLGVLRRYRDLRFLLTAEALSWLGSWLLLIAAPYYVLQVTHSALSSGLTFAVESVPAVLVGPFAGVAVDRFDRRAVMIVADLVRVGAVLLMLVALDPHQLWALYAGLVVESAFTQLNVPARGALLPQIVGRGGDLPRANALQGAALSAVQIAGAPLGGVLYVAFGLQAAVLADAATYAASALLLLGVRSRGVTRIASAVRGWRGVTQEIASGTRELANRPILRAVTVTGSLFMLGNGAANALLVAYLGGRVHLSAAVLGALFAAFGATSLLAAPYAGRLVDQLSPRLLVTGALAVVTTAFAVLFNVPWVPAVTVAFLAIGPPAVALGIAIDTLVQRDTSDVLLGRVSAGYRTANRAATMVGELGGSLLIGVLGLTATLDAAVLVVALSVVSALRLPTRRPRSLTVEPATAQQAADASP